MLATRSVPIQLKRKPKRAEVDRFRERDATAVAELLAGRLAGWARTALPILTLARPALPDELSPRKQDIWEPLFAIADAAGGDWPTRARAAAVELHGGEVADESVGVLLLRHIRETFDMHGALDRMSTVQLLGFLVERDDGPWGDWWGNDVDADRLKGPAVKLARLLKPYGVVPKVLRFELGTERGYERAAFAEPWVLYCAEDVTDVTPQVSGHIQHVTGDGSVTTPKPPLTSNVTSVTSSSAEEGRRDVVAHAQPAVVTFGASVGEQRTAGVATGRGTAYDATVVAVGTAHEVELAGAITAAATITGDADVDPADDPDELFDDNAYRRRMDWR